MTTDRLHVVIAGGGIAGVEALLALRAVAHDHVTIDLIAPDPDLVVRPLAVVAPFGTEEVRRIPLREICAEHRARLHVDAVSYVDAARHRVETEHYATIDYDVLIMATGAARRPALEGTISFDGAAGVHALRRVLDEVRGGTVHHVLFAIPDGVTWPLPLYELALMTAREAAHAGTGARVSLVTPEHDPLDIFGVAAATRVARLLERAGVTTRTRSHPFAVAVGTLLTSSGALAAQRIFTLPSLDGPRIPGLPHDAHGFLPVDAHGAVRGVADVYAAGDGTDQPVKQGGLAAQQADAAVDAIAARLGLVEEPAPFTPVLRAQLLTGALPWYLRGGEAADAPLWWPPTKVAARHLGPYLGAPAATPALDPEREAAYEVALLFADEDAAAGDRRSAIRWLDAAEHAHGLLSPEDADKRRRWAEELAETRMA